MIEPVQLTDDVSLRIERVDDAADLAAAYLKNREHLAPWDPVRPDEFYTEASQQVDIRKQLALYEAGTSAPFLLVSGNAILGRVNLTSIVHGPLESAILGYWVDADQAGKGLISRAVQAVITIARDDLKLHRIEAGTLVHNLASQRVLQKAGFEQFGLAPKYLRIGGEWQDHRLFQLLLHD